MARYKYEIWTKYFPHVDFDENQNKPSLFATCKSFREVGDHLGLTASQARERWSWSRGNKLGGVWHINQLGYGIGYQIIRHRLPPVSEHKE